MHERGLISLVIPVFNEEESLRSLHAQLRGVAQLHGYSWQMIFVDDGSTDRSWQVIEELASSDNRVRGIQFRRNFGKAAALRAGFQEVVGTTVVTLDADLQDDPQEIPKFLQQIEQGFDVVSGWKRTRFDPWHKVLPSRIFNRLVGWFTGVSLHDHNCGFKCYRAEVLRELPLYGELHRFIPVLAAARGWRIGEVEVRHRRREFGRSKYGLGRIPKGFLDLLTVTFLTGYGQRPQHLLGMLGLISFSAGSIGMIWLTIYWVLSRTIPGWHEIHLHQRAVFYYSMGAVLLGAQFLSIGILAEQITALSSRDAHTYSIARRVGDVDPPQSIRS